MEEQTVQSHIVVIEVGSTRTKLGWIDSENRKLSYKIQNTKQYMLHQDQIAECYANTLQENGVQKISKIVISCSGQIDNTAGVIIDGHALNRNSKKKFINFPFVQIIQTKFALNEVYLLNDGHGIGISIFYWLREQQKKNLISCVVLTLGTHPALVYIDQLDDSHIKIIIFNCRTISSDTLQALESENKPPTQTLSELVKKNQQAVVQNDTELYSRNVAVGINLICAHLQLKKMNPSQNFVICGGLANLCKHDILNEHAKTNAATIGELLILADDNQLMPILLQNLAHYPDPQLQIELLEM